MDFHLLPASQVAWAGRLETLLRRLRRGKKGLPSRFGSCVTKKGCMEGDRDWPKEA